MTDQSVAMHDTPCPSVVRVDQVSQTLVEWQKSQNSTLGRIENKVDEALRQIGEHKAFHLGGERQESRDQGRFRWTAQMALSVVGLVVGNGLFVGAVMWLITRLVY